MCTLAGLGACAEPPLAEGPATVLTGVQGIAGPWTASAARVELLAGVAHAEGVKASAAAQAGAPPLLIEAATSEWDLKAHRARFTTDVKVTRGPVTMTADQLEVVYKDASHVDIVTATGHVRVTRGERVAHADKGVLTAGEGRIVLTGSPVLTEGINALAGDRIDIFLDEEKATCTGAAGAPCRLQIADGLGVR